MNKDEITLRTLASLVLKLTNPTTSAPERHQLEKLLRAKAWNITRSLGARHG